LGAIKFEAFGRVGPIPYARINARSTFDVTHDRPRRTPINEIVVAIAIAEGSLPARPRALGAKGRLELS
jgi:hypothetical protein